MVAFLIFRAKIGLSTFMEVLSWLIRSVPLASAAALAQMLAPSALSLRVIPSSSSMPVLAWTAVPAQIPAPTALSLPLNNQNSNIKTPDVCPVFFFTDERRTTMAYRINSDSCLACGSCADDCPLGIISAETSCYVIDELQGVDCGSCAATCPVDAISLAK